MVEQHHLWIKISPEPKVPNINSPENAKLKNALILLMQGRGISPSAQLSAVWLIDTSDERVGLDFHFAGLQMTRTSMHSSC